MGKVYYNQADSRWGSHPYTAPGYPNATVKTSGCGPTCAAMIVSSCKEIVTPDRMCDISKENGFRVSGGTANGLFPYVAQRWGIEMKTVKSSYEAHQACKEGYFVVILCGAGLWTTGGHFILAVGANDTDIEIYDPYLYNGKFNINGRAGKVRLNGNSAWVEINTFKANSNARLFWAFKVGATASTPTTPNTSADPKVKFVNTNSANLNVRSGAGTNNSVVGSLAKGTQVLVYEESNGWSRIGAGKWVSSQYLADAVQSQPVNYNRGTVGTTKTFAGNTVIYSNSNLSGTTYNYLPRTAVVVLENTGANVDKIKVVKTGRIGYVNTSVYTGGGSVSAPVSSGTVGQTRTFKGNTVIYSNSNLSGTRYNYLPRTQVKILQNVSGSVDKIYVVKTGRTGYVSTSVYN